MRLVVNGYDDLEPIFSDEYVKDRQEALKKAQEWDGLPCRIVIQDGRSEEVIQD